METKNTSKLMDQRSIVMIDRPNLKQAFGKLRADPSALQNFISNPRPVLEAAGIPVGEISTSGNETDQPPDATKAAKVDVNITNYWSMGANLHWWGIDFTMNEGLTQAVANGTIASGALTTLISSALIVGSVLTGPLVAPIAAGFTAAFILKASEIKLVDQGNGVYWPITWVQWALVLSALPIAGPPGVIAQIMLFIHPLPN